MPSVMLNLSTLSTLVALLLALGPVAYCWATFGILATGDGYSVYFPVVWDLADGRGLASFEGLAYGAFRAPLFSVQLYLTTLGGAYVGEGLTLGCILAALCSFAWAEPLPSEKPMLLCAIVLLVASTSAFIHAMSTSAPDILCAALALACIKLTRNDQKTPAQTFLGGVLVALSILTRFNAIVLLLIVPLLSKRLSLRSLSIWVAGAVAGLVPWVCVSLILGHGPFWFPSGLTAHHAAGLPTPSFVPGAENAGSLIEAAINHPKALLATLLTRIPQTLHRGFDAIGWPVWLGLIAVLLLDFSNQYRTTARELVAAIIFVAPLLFVPVEPRYFLIPCFILSIRAAHGYAYAAQRLTRPLIFGLLLLWGCWLGHSTWQSRFNLYSVAKAIHLDSQKVLSFARSSTETVLFTDRLTYLHTPLRYHFRRARRQDQLKCCGDESSTVIVQIQKRPTISSQNRRTREDLGLTTLRIEELR